MSNAPYLGRLSTTRYLVARGKGLGLPLTASEEKTILAVMAGHVTAKDLGAALGRSSTTIHNHLYQIYAKTGAVNLAQIVLMITGVTECPPALLPVQRQWRRQHYGIDKNA